MKLSLVFLFVGLVASGLSTRVVDKMQLERQKKIMQLFYHINQPSYNPEMIEMARNYNINENVEMYMKPEVVKTWMQYYKYDLLPRGAIFSTFNMEQMHQAIALFRMFYYAKDWETFYKTAVWARQNVNEGMFVYTLSVAVIHRPDMKGMKMPPIYEIFPHYFFSSEVINKAYQLKQRYSQGYMPDPEQPPTNRFIESNYSGWYLNLHPEQSMSYYLEDIGINSFYYYFNLYYPGWMNSEEFGWTDTKRGELFYYFYQQVLARYYLERIANGFGEVPMLDWQTPVETPYVPSLVYPNGLEFPSRPRFAMLSEYFYTYGQKYTANIYSYSYNFVRDYERRINDAIDSGYILTKQGKMIELYTEEGLELLGNLIQANADSPNNRYYGSMMIFARHLLGYSYQSLDNNRIVPSALEHYETALRDPVFYQLIKKVVLKFQRYFSNVQPYTEKELVMQGVKISMVDVDELVTYDDWYYTDLQNAVYYNQVEEEKSFHVRVRQLRLNHKPFAYKMKVKSDKDQMVSVKVYLGPKYDEYGREYNLTENRMNFVELDHWVQNLKAGENDISRGCHQSRMYARDAMSDSEMYREVVAALKERGVFDVDPRQNFYSFPMRYMLPRGSEQGTPYQFFFMVYPYIPYKGRTQELQPPETPRPGTGDVYVDNSPLGYPFDRFIKFEKMWYKMPNMYFTEEKIYYRNE